MFVSETNMLRPKDPISEMLGMCCGLGPRKRMYKPSKSLYYGPSPTMMQHSTGTWPMPGHPFGPAPTQPYFLFTQPVIITGNPVSNPTNSMTLVQHAQTSSHPGAGQFSAFPMIQGPSALGFQQPGIQQPGIISSQYAICNTSANMLAGPTSHTIFEHTMASDGPKLDRNQSTYMMSTSPIMNPMRSQAANESLSSQLVPSYQPRQTQQDGKPVVSLSSEIFRKLELIEKQADISRDTQLVERHGIVITRALDPYTLMPHLSETTLARYQSNFLFNDKYLIRFIEIIKRPGQTLGLYIRTVQFEDSRSERGSRSGLVITNIDADSPVYNSPILSAGDEIISVNLIDVQGMSLDDVVIIMSIPKRLVLALQVPRERDHFLSLDLMRRQQLLRDTSQEQQEDDMMLRNENIPRPSTVGPQESAGSGILASGLKGAQTSGQGSSLSYSPQNPIISNIRLGSTTEQSSYFSSSIDAINRELKELRRQRMALSNNEQNLGSSQVEF